MRRPREPARPRTAAQWQAKHFHNQPAQSHQHRFLVDLWEQVKKETGGRVRVTVHPQNNGIPGGDPAALAMLQTGDLVSQLGSRKGRVELLQQRIFRCISRFVPDSVNHY